MPRRNLYLQRLILSFLGKRSAQMQRQWGFSFDQGDMIESMASLNEAQRKAIRAALKALFEAAVSFSEDSQDDKRKS